MYLERNPYTRKKTHLLHTVNIETEKKYILFDDGEVFFHDEVYDYFELLCKD